MDSEVEMNKTDGSGELSPGCSGYSGMVHSKKVIKHALRQQAKRRRKNTTIASGNSRALPRIVVKPLAPPPVPPPPPPDNDPPPSMPNIHRNATVEEPAATMREVLASLPGFSLKSNRRRSTKRLSAAAQLEAGLVDLESPASILASTSLRALLNRHTFQGLPPLYQRKLAQLLPGVDRQDAATSGLNNEFFARACLEWRKRLAEGEFTPENQQRLKMEAEKDKNKLDPWKLKHFEPIWGDKREPKLRLGLNCMNETRTGGAVTRSSLRLRLDANHQDSQMTNDLFCRPVTLTPSEKTETIESPKLNPGINDSIPVILTQEESHAENIVNKTFETQQALKSDDLCPEDQTDPGCTEIIANGNIDSYSQPDIEPEPVNEPDLPAESECLIEMEIPMDITQVEISDMSRINEKPIEDIISVSNKPINQIQTEITNDIHVPTILAETIIISTSIASTTATPNVLDSDQQHLNELTSSIVEPIDHIEQIEPIDQDEQIEHIEGIQSIEDIEHIEHECSSQDACDSITELTMSLSQVSEIQVLQDPEGQYDQPFNSPRNHDKIFKISECENTGVVESMSQGSVKSDDLILEEDAINVPMDAEGINVSTADTEPIPEGMEIDSETLQRIHELEVRGEMREAYEEISGCTEEIIYPILEGMEMGSNGSEEAEVQGIVDQPEEIRERGITESNEDEELRDANNYVCSEMLECSWPVEQTVNNNATSIDSNSTQEDLQVPWPLVAAALDGSVAANITVTTQEDCSDTSTSTESIATVGQTQKPQQLQLQHHQPPPPPPPPLPQTPHFVAKPTTNETINCVSLPVVQSTAFQESMPIGPAASNCLLKNLQPQSPPIIAFPPLQSIRFVPRFHQNPSHTSALPTRIAPQQQTTHQEMVQLTGQNSIARVANNIRNNSTGQHVQSVTQGHPQSAIVVQHQTPMPVTQSRQIVTSMPPQQYTSSSINARSARSGGQGTYRGSRNGNKEQGSGRSRSSTKEPPGAVNLERSYQICQAVIQSSPNRDQLKAHLKPPPSLLARGDGAFTTSKTGGRTITTVKTQKHHLTTQQGGKQQNKTQAVMLRQVFATSRQAQVEVTEAGSAAAVAQLGTNGSGNFGQYILVQRTGVSDGAPRASSAPPLPPQIANIGVGVHLVRGRPASAGEGSHQAVTLKARGISDGRGGGGAEPSAPGVIMGGDPPPPCECSMRGAMVICQKCGDFCHDDCMGPQKICTTCFIP